MWVLVFGSVGFLGEYPERVIVYVISLEELFALMDFIKGYLFSTAYRSPFLTAEAATSLLSIQRSHEANSSPSYPEFLPIQSTNY